MTDREEKLLELFRKTDERGKENILWLAVHEAEHPDSPTRPKNAP